MNRTITAVATAFAILVSAYSAEAQQKAPLIGFLSTGNEASVADRHVAFREQMRALGYVEGRTIRYAYRYADRKKEQLAGLAAELVRLKPAVIVTSGTPPTRAAKQATRIIPIVMSGADPVRSGLVKSLARPGGNITGQTVFPGLGFWGKRLALLKEAVPRATLVGVLHVPGHSFHELSLPIVQASAGKIGVTILQVPVAKPEDVKGALDVIKRERAGAFFNLGSPMIATRMKQMIAFARDNRLAYLCTRALRVRQGCLISYGVNFQDMFRRKAVYADKILKGADPAEMPVQEPTQFELAVNLKTAKAIGITIPPSILLRATEVVE